jgi:membrane-anchored protein YejM (alkaline phosphatase superfamily)
VSEAGIFGLTYGLNGQAFHSFTEARVPAYPIEVLKRNGYHTFLLASSRLNPYPSDQLVRMFDEVAYPKNDDEALDALKRYLATRHADRRPYFVLGFFYTPHYPFTSAKPQFRRYPLIGPSARTNYMNDVLQADDYFRQAFDLVRDDYVAGRTLLMATSDHGEEIRDHGVFGHASATFWNEKIVVPFMLGLPGREPSMTGMRTPSLTSHVDVWPTLFDYLGAMPRRDPNTYSDGRSLLHDAPEPASAYVSGRFFPYADRPSVLVDGAKKYWFRVSGVGPGDRLCVVVTRVTDLDDRPLSSNVARLDPRAIPAFEHLQSTFWRFVRPTDAARQDCAMH